MKYKYKNAKYPPNEWLFNEINIAAGRLYQKLINTEIQHLEISDDFMRFFESKQNSLKTNLIKYGYHLLWALHNNNRSLSEISIIDHGGGTGMLGLLAKELGIGTVIYNDINKEWTIDAENLASKLNLRSEYYISGDYDELLTFLSMQSILCDAIISYNVIEHIYDIYCFFSKLHLINSNSLTIIMSTGANIYNPLMCKAIIPSQKIAEYGDKNGRFGNGIPYLKSRELIIKDHNSDLSSLEISRLAKATRGLIKNDIIKVVNSYLSNKDLPTELSHPTNTCDPYSGYWAEHFIEPKKLKEILINNKFDVEIMAGYYGVPNNWAKRQLSAVINLIISIFGTRALFISPYWTIFAKK